MQSFWAKIGKTTKFFAKMRKIMENYLIFCQKCGNLQSFVLKIWKITKFFAKKNIENYKDFFLPNIQKIS